MENRRDEASEHESACARVAAQFPQLWLRLYVTSKLRRDPIYPAAYELFRGSDEPILDIGCGLGLLAFYLRERGCRQPILGLDLDARKIRTGTSRSRWLAIGTSIFAIRMFRNRSRLSPATSLSSMCFIICPWPSRPRSCRVSPDASRREALLVIRDCPRDNSPRFWMTCAGGEICAGHFLEPEHLASFSFARAASRKRSTKMSSSAKAGRSGGDRRLTITSLFSRRRAVRKLFRLRE